MAHQAALKIEQMNHLFKIKVQAFNEKVFELAEEIKLKTKELEELA